MPKSWWNRIDPNNSTFSPVFILRAQCPASADVHQPWMVVPASRPSHRDRTFRVAPERPKQPSRGQLWRADVGGDFGWEALSPHAFQGSRAAMVAVEERLRAIGCSVVTPRGRIVPAK